jgi:hypothetical protein
MATIPNYGVINSWPDCSGRLISPHAGSLFQSLPALNLRGIQLFFTQFSQEHTCRSCSSQTHRRPHDISTGPHPCPVRAGRRGGARRHAGFVRSQFRELACVGTACQRHPHSEAQLSRDFAARQLCQQLCHAPLPGIKALGAVQPVVDGELALAF